MKLFLDTANLDDIRRIASWGVIDGVTTNPSLIAREGERVEQRIAAICRIVEGDVSAPVAASIAPEMAREGRALAALHRRVVVKLPVTRDGIQACAMLAREGIRTNLTLCFTTAQALLAARAGAYIVSLFVGRLDDAGGDGIGLIRDVVSLYATHGYPTQVLAASVRTPERVSAAALAGAHIATVPPRLLEDMYEHPLTHRGIEQFRADQQRFSEELPIGGR